MKDKQLTKKERERRLEFIRAFGGGELRGGRNAAPVVRERLKARITLPTVTIKEK